MAETRLPRRRRELVALLPRVFAFAAVSGTGLMIDVAGFLLLTLAGLSSGLANLVSASLAVIFVYFISIRRIFAYGGDFLLGLFLVYAGYQIVAVTAASAAIEFLVAHDVAPIVAKLGLLPITFSANFIAMHFISRGRKPKAAFHGNEAEA